MRTVSLGIVCVLCVVFVIDVEGRTAGNSHTLLGSLMNTANAAANKVQTGVNQIVEKVQPNEPSISSGQILLDIMCSLCKEKNDIECINIHCTDTDPLPMMTVPPPQTGGRFLRHMEQASQLSRHESLHNTQQSTFPSRTNTGNIHKPSNQFQQTTPLPWARNSDMLNRSPSETGHSFQLPSQVNVNGQAGFPTTGRNNIQSHNPFERQRMFEQMVNVLFAAQQLLNGQPQHMPLFSGQPRLTTNQPGPSPALNFNPTFTEQTNSGMPHNEVRSTIPGLILPRVDFAMNDITGNQQTSNINTQNVARENSIGGRMNTGLGDNIDPFIPDTVQHQGTLNQQMPKIDTSSTGTNQQSAINGNTFDNVQNTGIPLSWDETRMDVSNFNQQGQSSTTPNLDDTTNQFTDTPTPDMDIFPVPLPTTTMEGNGVPMANLVVPLPGESFPITGNNNQQSPSINSGEQIGAALNDIPQEGQGFLPDGFVEWDTSMIVDNQGRPRNIDIPEAQDVFTVPNTSQGDTMNNDFQDMFPSIQSTNMVPHMQTFEDGSQVVRESLTDTDPTSWPELNLQDNDRWPVDLRAAVVTPFDDEGEGPEIPTRNDIFLDLGHGNLTPPQNHLTIERSSLPVEINSANLIDSNISPTGFINDPTTQIVADSNAGQGFNNVHVDTTWPVPEVNHEPIVAPSHISRPSFNTPHTDSGASSSSSGLMSMEELNAIVARNFASAVQSSHSQIGQRQELSVSRTRPVSLDNHNIITPESVSNINANIHLPQQNAHFVNTAQETLPVVPVEATGTVPGSNNGMDLSGLQSQQFQMQNVETTTMFSTILPTIEPRRKSELNSMAGQWLKGFRLK